MLTRRRLIGGALVLGATGLPAWAEKPKGGPLAAGMPAPVFRLRALDGAMVRLDELAYPGKEKSYAKKRPLFVDFFRTDCKPCINAMPELNKLAQEYQPKGIDFLLVAILEEQDGRKKLEAFLASQKPPMRVVVDEAQHFAKKYLGDPVTLPATFLIDRQGTVLKAKYGGGGTYAEYFQAEIGAALTP